MRQLISIVVMCLLGVSYAKAQSTEYYNIPVSGLILPETEHESISTITASTRSIELKECYTLTDHVAVFADASDSKSPSGIFWPGPGWQYAGEGGLAFFNSGKHGTLVSLLISGGYAAGTYHVTFPAGYRNTDVKSISAAVQAIASANPSKTISLGADIKVGYVNDLSVHFSGYGVINGSTEAIEPVIYGPFEETENASAFFGQFGGFARIEFAPFAFFVHGVITLTKEDAGPFANLGIEYRFK